jgi:hypothetical protein
VAGEGPVANDVVRAGDGEIQNRGGGDGEPGGPAVEADQGAGQPSGPQTGARFGLEQPSECGGRRVGAPVRRAQAGDPAALLIHHQVGIGGQHGPQRGDQAGELLGVFDVARKQDDAGRRKRPEQGSLLRQQNRSGDADDGGLGDQIRSP